MSQSTILALDVGARRIGVARADSVALIPSPLTTLENTNGVEAKILEIINTENSACLVIGLPRGMESQETQQTKFTQDFISKLQEHIDLPIYTQDEAVTSIRAREILDESKKPYQKSDVDAMAASLILQDFIDTHPDVAKIGASA